MNDTDRQAKRLDAIDGADAAALGLTPPPEPAPDGAEIEDAEHLVPGASWEHSHPEGTKPWQTTLAARSAQAGVANDPPDAQPPLYPNEAVTRAEDESDPH